MTTMQPEIDNLVDRARKAQQNYEASGTQGRFDRAAQAAAWALMEPARNAELAAFAVAETGLGNSADKITKNYRKTLGLLRDIKGQKSFGLVDDNPTSGVSEFLRPKGVVAAIVPSTNPLATPVNNVVNALKTGNAIILAPSPKGVAPLEKLLGYIYAEFDRIGLEHDLVQMVPSPPSKDKTARLMELADRFGLPVITFVDTAGAYPGIGAEERGQAEAIARSIEVCLDIKVPIVSLVIGEGGSGGAIAIAAANRILMLEHSVYSVISPEGCASILWRDGGHATDAANALKLTAQDLLEFGVIDEIITEPVGAAHRDGDAAIKAARAAIQKYLDDLRGLDGAVLRQQRRDKFLKMGDIAGS